MHEVNDRSRDIGEFVPAPDDDMLICRCEEITKGEIRKAVYEGNKIGQGRENAKQFLLDNPEIREEVDRRVREHYGIVDGVKEAEASDDAKQTKAKKKADTEE